MRTTILAPEPENRVAGLTFQASRSPKPECTRFPPVHGPNDKDSEGFLVRAADLIGQLGDPHYLRKANALYHEFEEVGMNRQLGYASPADLTDRYPQFYWSSVSVHI